MAAVAHDRTPVLAGLGLTLRGVTTNDVAAVRSISFYDGVAARDDEEAVAMLLRIHGDVARGDGLHWGICLEGSAEVTGTIGFYRAFPGGVGEIGYVLREAYRGRGIMTRAVRLVVGYGLGELGLRRVEAHTDADNVASRAVLARAGFVEDGGVDGRLRHVVRGPTGANPPPSRA